MKTKTEVLFLLAASLVLTSSADSLASREDRELRQLMKLTPAELPMNREAAVRVTPTEVDGAPRAEAPAEIPLDGWWRLTRDDGRMAVPARVPGSVLAALTEAGAIPDPYFGTNAVVARPLVTEHDWTYWRTFTLEKAPEGRAVLSFDGVCDRMTVELNGRTVGSHQGMFGGPDVDVSQALRPGENKLVVRLKRALPWRETVVVNCTYGWHYSQLVPLGIWRGVRLRFPLEAELTSPFVTVRDARKGEVSYRAEVKGEIAARKLSVTVGTDGKTHAVTVPVTGSVVRLDFAIPDPRLWWPNGHGEQPLYTLESRLISADGRVLDVKRSRFGLRDLVFRNPSGNGAWYARQAVVNGKPIFLKGANWCTADALLRVDRARYAAILARAKEQGTNWFRAWGGGLMETDDFYDLCDELGILVMQEWPSCWDSHRQQPRDALEETVRRTTERLRNHPSLAIWCGGNEGSGAADDPVMWEVLGRGAMLGDGTRPFYVQDNYGGADSQVTHRHIRWTREYPERLPEIFHGKGLCLHEFGNDAALGRASLAKIVLPEDLALWPIPRDGAVSYHTSTFGGFNAIHRQLGGTSAYEALDVAQTIVDRYSGQRIELGDVSTYLAYARSVVDDARLTGYDALAFGSQFVQAMAVAPLIAESRLAWPRVPSVCYYKLNDVAPAGTWAVVDWFGLPKIAHWFVQDYYAPTTALAAVPTTQFADKPAQEWKIPVGVVSDEGRTDVTGRVTLYGPDLKPIVTRDFTGRTTLALTHEQAAQVPSILISEAHTKSGAVASTWLPLNYAKRRGSLLDLPKTTLTARWDGGELEVTNTGSVLAVGVQLTTDDDTSVRPSDNWFCLAPGATRRVVLRPADGKSHPVAVKALNGGPM